MIYAILTAAVAIAAAIVAIVWGRGKSALADLRGRELADEAKWRETMAQTNEELRRALRKAHEENANLRTAVRSLRIEADVAEESDAEVAATVGAALRAAYPDEGSDLAGFAAATNDRGLPPGAGV